MNKCFVVKSFYTFPRTLSIILKCAKDFIRYQFNSLNGVDYSKNESEEVRKLRREIKRLKDENEFLKKATAYFANDQK